MKVHWCCGDVWLKGYRNIDIEGYILSKDKKSATKENWEFDDHRKQDVIKFKKNPNETTIDKYFKYKFGAPAKPFIIDREEDILRQWPFKKNSIGELVMISCIEHFCPKSQLPHIFKEINRTVKIGGKLLIDWPDLRAQFDKYYGVDDEFLIELIYCNHKNKYSIHHWGFTNKTFPSYLGDNWNYEFKRVVKHDYPMQGCVATRIK